MKHRKTCAHAGRIIECSITFPDIVGAVEEGKEFFVHGTCAICGDLIEREYGAVATLPRLQAELVKTTLLTGDTQVLPWSLADACIPAEVYVVHPGEGLTGICGLRGLSLRGVHAASEQFVYQCGCGFKWRLCAHDLGQMIVLGLHRSAAARRALCNRFSSTT